MHTFEVRLPNLPPGEDLPVRFTDKDAGGANTSPPLHMDGVPADAQSLAFMLFDKDASGFVHWLVVDVPPGDVRIPEGASNSGALPAGARELFNSAGFEGYQGPDPPPRTGKHRYELLAYALDEPSLRIPQHASVEEFRQAAEQHAVAEGDSYWRFGLG